MNHIVFNEHDIQVLESVLALDESLAGMIFQIKDDFAVGPIAVPGDPEGVTTRKSWWKMVLEGGDYENKTESHTVDDESTVNEIKKRLTDDANETVWIWCAQNGHDVSGYYWLISQLKEWQGRVFILYLNNLPFINEKGHLFYPEWISQIQPKEFLKAKKLARPVTGSEFEVDPDEWAKLCSESKQIRLLEGGKKLLQEEVDFFDTALLQMITGEFQKASKIIHQYLSKSKYTTGDAFLLWRLKQIIAAGNFEVQGNLGRMKDFEVKKTSNLATES
jgi:hypothetical protein